MDDLYAICLMTGASGKDATALYADPKLIGHIYAAPYVVLNGCISYVAEDQEGVLGYAVGAPDTRTFERLLETDWWPRLRPAYPNPTGDRNTWSPDELRARMIHHPQPVPNDIVGDYPAHIHMNLLPRARGKGVGTRLLEAWMETARAENVPAVHAGVGASNQSGLKFWSARGFRSVRTDPANGSNGTIWTGRFL
ncbi:N-acetyltransferase [Roseibium sp.]|uniref:GNAT family N-acetyltransferase n=1 Tax=Roseibium sp. TaxID=1936156 RepID=UPI0026066269|nr:GNAT family N-acetyltransferase [Roseibium sp.]